MMMSVAGSARRGGVVDWSSALAEGGVCVYMDDGRHVCELVSDQGTMASPSSMRWPQPLHQPPGGGAGGPGWGWALVQSVASPAPLLESLTTGRIDPFYASILIVFERLHKSMPLGFHEIPYIVTLQTLSSVTLESSALACARPGPTCHIRCTSNAQRTLDG